MGRRKKEEAQKIEPILDDMMEEEEEGSPIEEEEEYPEDLPEDDEEADEADEEEAEDAPSLVVAPLPPPEPPTPPQQTPQAQAKAFFQEALKSGRWSPKKPSQPKAPSQKNVAREKLDAVSQAWLDRMGVDVLDASGLAVTVKRKFPKTWEDEAGNTVQIEGLLNTFREPVSEEQVKELYGGGVYEIEVKGPNPDPKATKNSIITLRGPFEWRISGNPRVKVNKPQQQAASGGGFDASVFEIQEKFASQSQQLFSDQITRLERERSLLLDKMERQNQDWQARFEKLQTENKTYLERTAFSKQQSDPRLEKLVDKALEDDSDKLIKFAALLAPKNDGIRELSETIAMQTKALTTQLESATKMAEQRMELQMLQFKQQMEHDRKMAEMQLEAIKQQMEAVKESVGKKNKESDSLVSSLGAVKEIISFTKTLKEDMGVSGGGDATDKDSKDTGSEPPWYAKTIMSAIGGTLGTFGAPLAGMMGSDTKTQQIIAQSIPKMLSTMAAEGEPPQQEDFEEEDDFDEDEVPTPPPPQQAQTQQQPPQPQLDRDGLRTLTFLTYLEEAIATGVDPYVFLDEFAPIIKKELAGYHQILLTMPATVIWDNLAAQISNDPGWCLSDKAQALPFVEGFLAAYKARFGEPPQTIEG